MEDAVGGCCWRNRCWKIAVGEIAAGEGNRGWRRRVIERAARAGNRPSCWPPPAVARPPARPCSTHRRGLPRDRKLHPPSRRGTFCEERAPPAQMESGGPPGKQSWRRPSGAAARLAAPSPSQHTCAQPPRVASWEAATAILVARDERTPRATAQPRSFAPAFAFEAKASR